MGPPLSQRETRRSGRRSAPSVSKSVSKSPETELPPPKQKEKETTTSRPPLSSSHSSNKSKRLKQEEIDDNGEEHKSGSVSSNSNSSGRSKRKTGTKDKQPVTVEPLPPTSGEGENVLQPTEQDDEEEQGVTRCVCGSTGEDDPDAGEFMVQCEGCKVWQHGLCMGFESEDQLPDDDYYCEECDPERHKERLSKRRSRRPRQVSQAAHSQTNAPNTRVSRSHSPSASLRQQSKRRNTMNSRDAAFDESLKEVLEATAAEAAAHDIISGMSTDLRSEHGGVEEDNDATSNRKKRKRMDDETSSKKRTRSASTASDQPHLAAAPEDLPEEAKSMPPPKSTSRSNKRGSKKPPPPPPLTIENANVDGEDTSMKRPTQSRTKSIQKSSQQLTPSAINLDGGSKRGQGTPGNAQPPAANIENSRGSHGYRSIHSSGQQSLYTSWNLPDYLAHLEPILPSHVPPPLEVRSGSTGLTVAGKSENVELTMERGVKVKWPSKRMSVGDMNKRVRALVEWVGREQASALDRIRRQDALNRALQGEDVNMADENPCPGKADQSTNPRRTSSLEAEENISAVVASVGIDRSLSDVQSSATMKMMEELMEELIGFQERFGPGSKNRERRVVSN